MKAFRTSLSILAARLPDYSAQIAAAEFECCHLNEKWILRHCGSEDYVTHQRYLIEYAAEVLHSENPSASAVLDDTFICRSGWLRELKAKRQKMFGSYQELIKRPGNHYFFELSPGWREFIRVRESSASVDRKQVKDQLAEFVHCRAVELIAHNKAIAFCCARLPSVPDALGLQSFFAHHLAKEFDYLDASYTLTLVRNQALQRDEQRAAVVFAVSDNLRFVLLPTVVASTPNFQGTLGVGFRLMTPAALAAPKFEFGRDTVLHLYELLPDKFNGYGRFDRSEEYCLNILAWTAALRILLPDVLQTLRAAAQEAARSPLSLD